MSPRVTPGAARAVRPSGAVQEYVMAVRAQESRADRPVGSCNLAVAMRVTVPSAFKMAKRLPDVGLAERTARHGLRLTPAGRVVAR